MTAKAMSCVCTAKSKKNNWQYFINLNLKQLNPRIILNKNYGQLCSLGFGDTSANRKTLPGFAIGFAVLVRLARANSLLIDIVMPCDIGFFSLYVDSTAFS